MATEGALLGSVLQHGFPKDLPVVSDDAGQFNVLCHGLCWVHAERPIHTLVPLNQRTGENLPRCAVSSGSCMLISRPTKRILHQRRKSTWKPVDALFTTQTSFETLNQTLRRIHRHKAELLLVLDRPDIVLHTNGSERDLRDPVKKRKLSCIGILPMISVEGPDVTWGDTIGIPS
jgi:hypothetical protein